MSALATTRTSASGTAAAPALAARPKPTLGSCTRSAWGATAAAASYEPSLDPESTTTTSSAPAPCREARQATRSSRVSWTTTMTAARKPTRLSPGP